VAGAEVGSGGPDSCAGDEFEGGPRGWPGPAVEVEPHGQRRAQGAAGQADLDPVGTRIAIVPDGPAQQALADVHLAVGCGALPVLKCGHACLERDVNDPPEREQAHCRAFAWAREKAHFAGMPGSAGPIDADGPGGAAGGCVPVGSTSADATGHGQTMIVNMRLFHIRLL
jgi:hypothetical protein